MAIISPRVSLTGRVFVRVDALAANPIFKLGFRLMEQLYSGQFV